MTYSVVSSTFTYEAFPVPPNAPFVALQAGTTEWEAQTAISTAWAIVSNYTRRAYRSVLSGVVIVRENSSDLFPWPVCPAPAAIQTEYLVSGGWQPYSLLYIPDVGADLDGPGVYRLTQTGTVAAPAIPDHVLAAVQNLALYLLIQAPHRREFKTQGTGDSNFTRESYMGLLYGSGAGAMLAGEVIL